MQEKIHQALVEAIETFLQCKISDLYIAPETLQQVMGGWAGGWFLCSKARRLESTSTRSRCRGQSLGQLLPELSDETLDCAAHQLSARLLQ